MFPNALRALLIFTFSTLLVGCAQPYPEVEPDFEANWQTTQHQADVYLIPTAPEAFARRVELVRNAQKSIDMTYFSWESDTLGLMLLSELKQAADRGVQVRLTLDDLLVFNEKWLADLTTHDNIQIRLFNPFDSRKSGWIGRAVNFSTHQQGLDHRLHEKYFNVDHQWMILGGRNIGNDYFGYNRKANFFDMDVLFKGNIIQAFDQNYQQLWDSKHVTPIENIVKVSPNYSAFAKAVNKGEKDKNIILAEVEKQVKQLTRPNFITAHVTPVFDSLNKLENNKPYFRKRTEHQVWQQITAANKAVISTPYVVPSNHEFTFIDTLMEQKTDITLITNSSASNDSGFIPAYYEEHRQTLLDKGVNILEYKNQAKNDDHYFHADTYYHNKTVILDDQLTYIGSSNFDPRSDFLNVEFGVLIHSEAFAEHVMHYLTRQEDELFWRVSRNEQGQTQWQSMDQTHTKNPNYGGWHKMPNWIFKQLNGEFEL
ncbi:phospholipase D family protein [Vibrio parahaemolyticus]|uniref:Phospholipase D family protein n=1 Tax=Vibrio parahaemolyticus TaxID=670 RepID=A0AA46UGJ7_VIBPH|nr:phospholipase D family protein [Vibrio parahaemolyticus]AGQ92190.1 phospholipase D-family protein [Vibrio parahaemolyticus O1:Kuk str. FDA_R31]EGQ7683575.1 phospholipase D family protein [Vibrio parahaemolyticus]EGQ7825899.1 phospholipase D family protein [Vibrio parahaemolyticus]EGQ8084544.1 phospholipase D family protein [Vibrio parahaemolyticus]EGQ8244276.1 phospholipase [Vibrio parahaemolyticus]